MLPTLSRFLANVASALLLLFLASCGGGGGSSVIPPTVAPQPGPISEERQRNAVQMSIINAQYAYQQGYYGQGVTIGISDQIGLRGLSDYIIERGFHPDLTANFVPPATFGLPTISADAADTSSFGSTAGHGVGVAGVAVAASNNVGIIGVAPEAKWTFGNYLLYNNYFLKFAGEVPIVNLSYTSLAGTTGNYNGYSGVTLLFSNMNTLEQVNVPNGYRKYWGLTLNWLTYDISLSKLTTYSNGLIGLTSMTVKNTLLRDYLASYADEAEDHDTIFVWSAGNDRWHRGNDRIISFTDTDYEDPVWGKPPYGESIPLADALAPVLSPKLRNKWLAVAAYDKDRISRNLLAEYSNGCGEAMMWCLAAPGELTVPVYGRRGPAYEEHQGTSFAAPMVSGALALLKSAAPMLSMTVIHGILLRSATDVGETGVDDVFGWGLLNVSAGIKMIENMRTATPNGGTGVKLHDLRFMLPEQLSHIAGRLDDSVVALKVTDNAYYNLPFSEIAKINVNADDTRQTLSALHDWQEPLAQYAEEGHSAEPFFARDNDDNTLLQIREDGLRPFVSFAGDNLGDSSYKQFGFRWQESRDSFGIVAEISHIAESDTFWGLNFGAVGDLSTQTEQAKLILSGDLAKHWSGFAGYEMVRARTETKTANDTGNFIAGIEGARAAGWTAGLERRDVWEPGDRLRFLARQKPRINSGALILEAPHASGGFTEAFYDEIEQELTLRRTAIPIEEPPSVIWGVGYAVDAGQSEWSAAVEHDGGRKDTTLSAAWKYTF